MVTSAYIFIFGAAVFFAVLDQWFNRIKFNTKVADVGLIGAMLAYFVLLFNNVDQAQSPIIWIIIRDLGILFLISLITGRTMFTKLKLVLMIISLLIGFKIYSSQVMQHTFTANTSTATKITNTTHTTTTVNEIKKETENKAISLDKNGELLFEMKTMAKLLPIETAIEAFGGSIEKAFPTIKYPNKTPLSNYYVLNIEDKYSNNLSVVMDALYATKMVTWVEPNEMISLDEPMVGSMATNQRKTKNPEFQNLWGFDQMKVEDLFAYIDKSKVKPSKKAKIAILDTGVDAEHEDLKANFVSTDAKYNKDVRGHGTHCAGIAGAVSNNNIGIASLAPNSSFVEITSIKVLSDGGFGSQKAILDGIIKAADINADVVSMSLGGPASGGRQKAYDDAVAYANKAGAIVVVAAGNSSRDANKYTPANCTGVITVSAVDENLKIAEFSNFITNLDKGIAAPGVNVYSTLPNNKYEFLNGTSMATPYVAGLIGMMKAINPKITTDEVYQILKATGVDTQNTPETGKFIQPHKALQYVINS
jgi:thermitase